MCHRVEAKMRTKKVNEFLNRLHVAQPQPRDDKARLPYIPGMLLFISISNLSWIMEFFIDFFTVALFFILKA